MAVRARAGKPGFAMPIKTIAQGDDLFPLSVVGELAAVVSKLSMGYNSEVATSGACQPEGDRRNVCADLTGWPYLFKTVAPL